MNASGAARRMNQLPANIGSPLAGNRYNTPLARIVQFMDVMGMDHFRRKSRRFALDLQRAPDESPPISGFPVAPA